MSDNFDIFKGRRGNIDAPGGRGADDTIQQAQKKMSRFTILVILVGILIFAEGSGLIYFATRYQQSRQAVTTQREETKVAVIKPTEKESPAIDASYEELLSKYEAIKKDRDNLLSQAKKYFSEKKDVQDSGETATKLKQVNEVLAEERNKAVAMSKLLQDEIENLRNQQSQLIKEKEDLQKMYDDAKRGSPDERYVKKINNLLAEITSLKKAEIDMKRQHNEVVVDMSKETTRAKSELQRAEKELEQVSKEKDIQTRLADKKIQDLNKNLRESKDSYDEAIKEIRSLKRVETELKSVKATKEDLERKRDSLTTELKELRRDYEDALAKNKGLGNELEDLPRRFSELSKENTRLIKETAEMHYNLGVFYSKNKEFQRAIAEFEKSVELDPTDAQAHFNLGYLFAECVLDRDKAMEHFRTFLNLAKSDDEDLDWAKRYLLTWETFSGKTNMR
ncbi:MAG: tetratricopeptide repeat protein [Candidatus Omnitrophica bacterium]|nr:tetratricopeptide repeat protein [Candidatus Omnitrophota bacterium]